jgi:DNA mismatch repair ATPase MutS
MDVENIKYWLDALYRLDSLTTLLEVKNLLNMSYISYGSCEDDNILLLKELWHPSLHPDKIVKNNVVKNIHNRNMIITGPNAGGKSTLVKAILTNIIMGQTITMNCATQSIFVPFSLITSQINVPDCKGKESLFQAEMNRCKKVFERLKNVEQGKRAIVFMDEILSSTNPIEGIAGSYAILKNLTKYDNCAVVFTTHYNYLSKLEKVTEKIYMNYKMNVRVEDDDIDFLYTLSRGVSNQYIALKLLEKEGFDKEIISDALTLKERLCHVRPPSCV